VKVVCIIGSPREKGSTAFVVDQIIGGVQAQGARVIRHALGSLSIGYCQGCRTCEQTGRCVQRDDMDRVIADLLAADVVLVASPSYWGDVTGQLKVFIDRSLPLCNAQTGTTPVPPGKVGVAVAIRAGSRKAENQHIVDTIEHYFGHLGIEPVARFTAEGIEAVSDLSETQIAEARQLGRTIIASLQRETENDRHCPAGRPRVVPDQV
jgi:multimeric flavodoxin WrbA